MGRFGGRSCLFFEEVLKISPSVIFTPFRPPFPLRPPLRYSRISSRPAFCSECKLPFRLVIPVYGRYSSIRSPQRERWFSGRSTKPPAACLALSEIGSGRRFSSFHRSLPGGSPCDHSWRPPNGRPRPPCWMSSPFSFFTFLKKTPIARPPPPPPPLPPPPPPSTFPSPSGEGRQLPSRAEKSFSPHLLCGNVWSPPSAFSEVLDCKSRPLMRIARLFLRLSLPREDRSCLSSSASEPSSKLFFAPLIRYCPPSGSLLATATPFYALSGALLAK